MFGNEFDENYYLIFTDNFSSRISISHLFILYSSNFLIHLSKIEFVSLENFIDSAKYKKKHWAPWLFSEKNHKYVPRPFHYSILFINENFHMTDPSVFRKNFVILRELENENYINTRCVLVLFSTSILFYKQNNQIFPENIFRFSQTSTLK